MAVNASEVARLYSTDLSGVGDAANRFYDNMQRQQMFAQQQQLQRDRLSADLMQEAFSPLQQSSGTFYDQYVNQRLPQIQQSYLQFMKNKPNAPLAEQQLFLNSQIGNLGQQIQTAKMFQPKVQDYLNRVEKEMPYLNQLAIRDAINKSAFFDAQGNPLSTVNIGALDNIGSQLQNPQDAVQYVDPAQLNAYLGKAIKDNYAPQGFNVPMKDQAGIGYNLKGTMFPYQRVNPQTGEVELSTEDVTIGQNRLPALTTDAYGQVRQDSLPFQIFGDAVKNRLAAAYPEFQQLPEEVQDRIAYGDIFNRFGERRPTTAPTRDYDEFNAQMRQRQFEALERQRRIQNDISNRRLKIAEGKGNKRTSFDVFTNARMGTDPNTRDNDIATVKNYSVPISQDDFNTMIASLPQVKEVVQDFIDPNIPIPQQIGKLEKLFPKIDLSAMSKNKDGFVRDRVGGGKRKVYIVTLPTGEDVIVTKKTKKNLETGQEVIDESTTEVIPPDKVNKFISTLSAEFEMPVPGFSENYADTYDE